MHKTPKPKRCKSPECRQSFQPRNSMQAVCSPKCGLALASIQRKKREAQTAKLDRQQTREQRERIKTRSDYLKEAQVAFNAWIRERDRDLPCVSCGRHHQGQYHCGHYRTVAGSPALRYEPLNCAKQCAPCNNHKSGDIVNYRIELVKRIGQEAVEWLEGPHEPKRYTIEDLKEITSIYRAKVRELKKESQQ
ncbi:MAG: recombination protein NinG [Microbacterium sp.]|uniref:recombination protein NinG n=1 Tax=Microbacterium sp. TaxID=51671 RepID=UPI00261D7451|nr:recombination protein NinG [Microbacterium sp.]MCV0420082.1 recombination protein NinG [Microbacterium sp.]